MADTIDKPATTAGYEDDFYLWTQQQAEALRRAARDRINAPIDWENVAEEIESLGRSDKDRIENLANHILIHLIKLSASPAEPPRNGWKKEIQAARFRLGQALTGNPSLQSRFAESVDRLWPTALSMAQDELSDFGESKSADPAFVVLRRSPITAGDVLRDGFYPDRIEKVGPT